MLLARLARAARPATPTWARALATTTPAAGPEPTRSMNMCTAVNDAMGIIMETDPT